MAQSRSCLAQLRLPAPSTIVSTKTSVKVFSVSDLHITHQGNMGWIECSCSPPPDPSVHNVFIIPGDLGSDLDPMKDALALLKQRYDDVCFIVGNHDLWVTRDAPPAYDSISKFNDLLSMCAELGVHTAPIRVVSSTGSDGVCLIPLYSWYHPSWDTEPDLCNDLYRNINTRHPFKNRWSDFRRCKWPTELCSEAEFVSVDTTAKPLAEFFASLNEPIMSLTRGSGFAQENDIIISFSHFVPRQELFPEKRFILEPHLSKVIGSDPLEHQIRVLRPNLHVFGHTHIPIDLEVEGIRYLQWPLGYPKEQKRACKSVYNQKPLAIYNSNSGICDVVSTHWGSYYLENERTPTCMDLAPWVQEHFESLLPSPPG